MNVFILHIVCASFGCFSAFAVGLLLKNPTKLKIYYDFLVYVVSILYGEWGQKNFFFFVCVQFSIRGNEKGLFFYCQTHLSMSLQYIERTQLDKSLINWKSFKNNKTTISIHYSSKEVPRDVFFNSGCFHWRAFL